MAPNNITSQSDGINIIANVNVVPTTVTADSNLNCSLNTQVQDGDVLAGKKELGQGAGFN